MTATRAPMLLFRPRGAGEVARSAGGGAGGMV
jgi:hypothetical protein